MGNNDIKVGDTLYGGRQVVREFEVSRVRSTTIRVHGSPRVIDKKTLVADDGYRLFRDKQAAESFAEESER